MSAIKSSIQQHLSDGMQELLTWLPCSFSPANKTISPILSFRVSNFFVPPAKQHIPGSKAFLVPLAPHYGGKNRFTKAKVFADITGSWLAEITTRFSRWPVLLLLVRGHWGLQGRVREGVQRYLGAAHFLSRWCIRWESQSFDFSGMHSFLQGKIM